jgi:hypothetical protein
MSTAALGLWDYAEGDARLVGALVLIVVAAAIAYVGRRLWAAHRDRRR